MKSFTTIPSPLSLSLSLSHSLHHCRSFKLVSDINSTLIEFTLKNISTHLYKFLGRVSFVHKTQGHKEGFTVNLLCRI